MFTTQVTDFAGFRLGGVAGRGIAALVGVEGAEGGGAVAVWRHWVDMDVVHCLETVELAGLCIGGRKRLGGKPGSRV